MTPKYMRDLRLKMDQRFSEGELRGLAFDLAIDWEHLAGRTKPEKIRSLISHQARRGNLDDLIEFAREERPSEIWEDPPLKDQQIEDAQASIRDAALEMYLYRMERYIEQEKHNRAAVAMVQALTDKVWSHLDKYRRQIVIDLLIKIKLFSELNHLRRNLNDANFAKVDLKKADLCQANLVRANFFEANLTEADFVSANLAEVNFLGANLSRANLVGANLTFANLNNAHLIGAKLYEANLSYANLAFADFFGAKVTDKQLEEAIISNTTTMPNGGKWKPNW